MREDVSNARGSGMATPGRWVLLSQCKKAL